MSYAALEFDPGWVAWAENETIARLREQLSDRRPRRELRRVAQVESADPGGPNRSAAARLEAPVSPPPPVPAQSSRVAPCSDHPQHTRVTAFSEPPPPDGAAWHDWAEAQTVLRLQQPRDSRRKEPQPQPLPDLRIEVRLPAAPTRTIRVHLENLKAVGI